MAPFRNSLGCCGRKDARSLHSNCTAWLSYITLLLPSQSISCLCLLLALVAFAFAAPAEDRQKRSYYYAAAYPYYSYYSAAPLAYASNYVGVPGFASRYSYYSAPLVYVR
ncbi:unnamed protein product [Nezara viridula]|uniref:Uncharacterized protein n=1 Tax=Nezara viridula TaxID=85310 RepID=A0A9P0E6U3_NEZVI|nr:unnamed protein product [Nezara viridula]